MNAFSSLECLVFKNTISNDHSNNLKSIIASLPTSEGDLLQFISANLILNNESVGVMQGEPIGTQSITSTGPTNVKSLIVPTGARRAIVSVHQNNIIFRIDAGTPALNTGHGSTSGSNFSIANLAKFKFVSEVGTAVIFVTYF